MSGAAAIKIESLRPAVMQSRPVRMNRVFNDPNAIIDLIQRRASYPTLAGSITLGLTWPDRTSCRGFAMKKTIVIIGGGSVHINSRRSCYSRTRAMTL